MNKNILMSAFTGLSLLVLPLTSYAALTPKEELGKLIFFDTNLSSPAGQSCATCHDPAAGFADPDKAIPVSEGVVPGRFGRRNAPTITYAARQIGQFWDARAPGLVEQAKEPFLNPNELNNPDKQTVTVKVCSSNYSRLFKQVYGGKSCSKSNVLIAFDNIADAIAAFESSSELNLFTAKIDAVQQGLATLTAQESNGRNLFVSCAGDCHLSNGMPFRNIQRNLGLPKNTAFPFNTMDPTFVDRGVGKITGNPLDNGKFKTPHLRNVALTAPYMHNGVLKSLKEVVHFYNTRDIPGIWPAPEVRENMDTSIGQFGFTDAQEDDIVAFMMTFTDGFVP